MRTFVLLLFFLLPLTTHAALNAGVINGVWFSNPEPEPDETVRIFTAVQNSSSKTISGSVAFLVNEEIVGTTEFRIAPNDVILVSVPYVFGDGAYDVSAYITSADDSVAYTISPDTSVSVTRKERARIPNARTDTQATATSTALNAVTKKIKEVGGERVRAVQPVAERAAEGVERARDTLLINTHTTSTAATFSTDSDYESNARAPETSLRTTTTTNVSPARVFIDDAKKISNTKSLPLWKKVSGIGLSFVALALRLWWIVLILVVMFLFWRFTRGRRIV